MVKQSLPINYTYILIDLFSYSQISEKIKRFPLVQYFFKKVGLGLDNNILTTIIKGILYDFCYTSLSQNFLNTLNKLLIYMKPLSPLDFAIYIGSTPTFYISIWISTLHAYRLRSSSQSYYQRIYSNSCNIANENRGFAIAPCKFILIDITKPLSLSRFKHL